MFDLAWHALGQRVRLTSALLEWGLADLYADEGYSLRLAAGSGVKGEGASHVR